METTSPRHETYTYLNIVLLVQTNSTPTQPPHTLEGPSLVRAKPWITCITTASTSDRPAPSDYGLITHPGLHVWPRPTPRAHQGPHYSGPIICPGPVLVASRPSGPLTETPQPTSSSQTPDHRQAREARQADLRNRDTTLMVPSTPPSKACHDQYIPCDAVTWHSACQSGPEEQERRRRCRRRHRDDSTPTSWATTGHSGHRRVHPSATWIAFPILRSPVSPLNKLLHSNRSGSLS